MKRRQVSSSRRPYADQRMLTWTFAIALLAAVAFGLYVGYLFGATR